MARYDKYEPRAGGFRAKLAADFTTEADFEVPFGVGIDANGRAVIGTGNTGFAGVMILADAKLAGDVVDIMTNGEIVEAGLTAGSSYRALAADGTLATGGTAAAGDRDVGFTVEADRLIVRMGATT